MIIVNVKQIVKRSLAKLLCLGVGDNPPKIEVRQGKEVEEKLEILFLLRQKFQYPYLFAILFKVLDKLLDIIVLLSILDTENYADRIGFLIGRTGPEALVFTQGRLGSPFEESLSQGCLFLKLG